MIGWYCSAGIFEGNYTDLTNISQIKFLDVNTPFIIPVVKQFPPDDIKRNDFIGANDISEFYSLVDTFFGPDWYLIHAMNVEDDSRDVLYTNAYDKFTAFLPGWDKSWPNTIKYCADNYGTSKVACIYIPNLKRVLLYGSGPTMYKVNDDGSFSAIQGIPVYTGIYYGFFNTVNESLLGGFVQYVFALAVQYSSYDQLTNPSNFRNFFVQTTQDRSPQYYWQNSIGGWTSTLDAEYITYLFTDGTEPDFEGGEPPKPAPPDPYGPGGNTGPSGGDGDFDNTSTPIEIPELPQVSSADTGFISLFNPSIAQLQELSNYMWSDLFDVNGWKKIFANPMDAILGLSIVPVSVPSGLARPVIVGNINTGVSLTVASSQYVSVDCGTINVNEYWGAYLDYDPYTKAEIYLPYIGTHALAVDDIMNKAIHVVYHVDILSGACCAYVKCGESVLYSFVGQCSCSIPVTGSDWTNVINGALSIAASIGSMVATDGATAPMAVGAIASAAVNSLKPNIEKSGSMGGMGGMLGIQTPYLILTRPRQALPSGQNRFMGYPSFITILLGECSGYTEVDSIHLENIPATGEELAEIESLLKEGVIL